MQKYSVTSRFLSLVVLLAACGSDEESTAGDGSGDGSAVPFKGAVEQAQSLTVTELTLNDILTELDLNGDGGPDAIGDGLGTGALVWSAQLYEPSPGYYSFWEPEAAWDTPVAFRPDYAPAGGARLADVNNDGLVDIAVSDGAYLNLGEPPDMLESVSSLGRRLSHSRRSSICWRIWLFP